MKIILNTIASYSRTIISIVFVLFSSRWVLAALGISDFGIYSLVGSILAIVVFLNTILANGNSRFIAIAIGENNKETVKELFKTITVIHTVIPIIILILGYFIGVYAIENWLDIPVNRVSTTITVFQVAIISSAFAMIAVPYTASFIANQNIVTYSLITLLQSFLYFVSAFLLRYFHTDSLVTYAFLMSISNTIIYILLIVVAMKKYDYCRHFLSASFNVSKAKEIIKFAFWNFLGSFGHLCRTQGISIIVNLQFGTQGNAALGIANQVATQSANLTNALGSATSPEVYKRIGANSQESANELCFSISKFGTCLILLLSTVIITNIDDLLLLWLKTVPSHSSVLCICFMLMYILEKIPMGQNTYLSGINKVSSVQTLTLISYLLSIVFPFMGFTKVFGIEGIGVSCVLSMLLAILSVLYCYNRYSGFNYTRLWGKLFVVSICLFVSSLFALNCNNQIALPIYVRFVIFSLVMASIVIGVFYAFIFNKNERNALNKFVFKLCKKK